MGMFFDTEKSEMRKKLKLNGTLLLYILYWHERKDYWHEVFMQRCEIFDVGNLAKSRNLDSNSRINDWHVRSRE